MDLDRDDFEEKMEEDEVDALDEHDMLLGLNDEGELHADEDDDDEEKRRLENFFQKEGEEDDDYHAL